MRALTIGLIFASFACDSLSSTEKPGKTRAPSLDCTACYVVNTSLATHEDDVFVAGYVAEGDRGVLRRLSAGTWTNFELASLSGVLKLTAADDAVYLGTDDRILRVDLPSGAVEALDVAGKLAWAGHANELVVFDEGIARSSSGDTWSETKTGLGKPAAVSGRARDDLYVLDDHGDIAHASATGFERLSESPFSAKHIAIAGDDLLAVSGQDHGDGKTGPGTIMRFSDGQWSTLTEAPHDALLGVASHGEEIYAVGATRRDGSAIPVAWHFDGMQWSRHELHGVDAFLWTVACTEHGACYAAGTDNTFLDLSMFEN